jgi:hypothetical protein
MDTIGNREPKSCRTRTAERQRTSNGGGDSTEIMNFTSSFRATVGRTGVQARLTLRARLADKAP